MKRYYIRVDIDDSGIGNVLESQRIRVLEERIKVLKKEIQRHCDGWKTISIEEYYEEE